MAKENQIENPISQGKLLPEQREAMLRLVGSGAFAAAPRLRSVLAHLLQALEDGAGEEVTEQSIGQTVFGRRAGYNASEDNIVRVTIRHLRSRLDEYYRSEGVAEALVLMIPKGRYVPSFVLRETTATKLPSTFPSSQDSTSERILQPAAALQQLPGAKKPGWSKPSARIWLYLIAATVLAFITGYMIHTTHSPERHAIGLIEELLTTGDNVTLVAVDANLQAYRQIFGKQVSLDDYIRRTYGMEDLGSNDPRLHNARRFAMGANETNVSSAILAVAFRQALEGRRLILKHPHDVSVRDFQNQGNVILMGGPWIDPWGQLFENRFNFRLVPETESPATSEIQNLHPLQNEAASYRSHMEGDLSVNYVRVAILPNLDNTGHVVLLSATSAESLEAAGEYLLSADAARALLAQLHALSVKSLPPLELLLEAKGLNAAPGSHRLIGVRVIH